MQQSPGNDGRRGELRALARPPGRELDALDHGGSERAAGSGHESVTVMRNSVALGEGAPAELEELVALVFAAVAHEFKTPLAIVRAQAQLMARSCTENHAGVERIITRQVDRLTHLVQQCIEFSRLGAPPPRSTGIFELAAVVERAVRFVRAAAPRREILQTVWGRAAVAGDADRIEHAVVNLLDNAVRYSPRGGLVEASVRPSSGEVVVSVRDEGVGIVPELERRIFHSSFRAHPAAGHDAKGIGLGLRVCRDIIDSHGGRFWFQSKPGAGSTFSFSLPLAEDVSAVLPRHLVLVAEDDPDLLSIVALVLSASGYRVRSATNGEQALAAVADEMPRLIFLDMQMPGMDGWAFAREFRLRYGRACPIVVMTAADSARARADEIDAEAWLAKPFDIDHLVRIAERCLATSSSSGAQR